MKITNLMAILASAGVLAMPSTASAVTAVAQAQSTFVLGDADFDSSSLFGVSRNTLGGITSDTITFGNLVAGQMYEVTVFFQGTNLGSGVGAFIQGASGSSPLTITYYGTNSVQVTGFIEAAPLTTGNVGNVGYFNFNLSAPNALAQASYSGQISVAAVPEPETYALMAMGLGVVGFAARRRRQSQG